MHWIDMAVTVIKNNDTVDVSFDNDTVIISSSDETNIESDTFVFVGTLYDGTYEITPKVEGQSMPTKDRYMEQDVIVHGVPRYDVSNQYGTTCYIAADV